MANKTKQKEPVIIDGNGSAELAERGKTDEDVEATAVIVPIPEGDEYDWSKPIKSPFKRYPGSVSFPAHFTMPHFRAWKEVNEVLSELGTDGMEKFIGMRVERKMASGYYELSQPFDSRQWQMVLAMVEDFNLKNLPPAALKDESGESAPLEILAWLIPLTGVYIAEKLNLKN